MNKHVAINRGKSEGFVPNLYLNWSSLIWNFKFREITDLDRALGSSLSRDFGYQILFLTTILDRGELQAPR